MKRKSETCGEFIALEASHSLCRALPRVRGDKSEAKSTPTMFRLVSGITFEACRNLWHSLLLIKRHGKVSMRKFKTSSLYKFNFTQKASRKLSSWSGASVNYKSAFGCLNFHVKLSFFGRAIKCFRDSNCISSELNVPSSSNICII